MKDHIVININFILKSIELATSPQLIQAGKKIYRQHVTPFLPSQSVIQSKFA